MGLVVLSEEEPDPPLEQEEGLSEEEPDPPLEEEEACSCSAPHPRLPLREELEEPPAEEQLPRASPKQLTIMLQPMAFPRRWPTVSRTRVAVEGFSKAVHSLPRFRKSWTRWLLWVAPRLEHALTTCSVAQSLSGSAHAGN